MTPSTDAGTTRPADLHDPTTTTTTTTTTSCEVCGLVAGPFDAAEAAHLSALHDQLHHHGADLGADPRDEQAA